MDSVQEETPAVSATEVIVDNQHTRPLLLPEHRHRLTEEDLRKAAAFLERKVKGYAKNVFWLNEKD